MPYSQKPSLRFATVPYSYTHVTLQKYFPTTFNYMKKYSIYNDTSRAIKAVKDGDLDAFIYDGTVLSYMASQDEECRLLQVGSWSAMTGYALAFPHHSKFKLNFNAKILELRENGDLERLSRFWMSGTCKPRENLQEKRASEPLSIAQFLSAFLLLAIGMGISMVLLLMEHFYMRYLQTHVQKTTDNGCCALISQSIGNRLMLHQAAEATSNEGEILSDFAEHQHRCSEGNLSCNEEHCHTKMFQLTAQLACANHEISYLESLLSKANELTGDNAEAYSEERKTKLLASVQCEHTDQEAEEELEDEESFNEMEDHITELESVPKDLLMVLQKRGSSSASDIEEKETVL